MKDQTKKQVGFINKSRISPKHESKSEDNSKGCKATYLCVKPSVADELENKDEFLTALCLAGYNPTPTMISELWPSNTGSMPFTKYCTVVEALSKHPEEGIMKLFQQLNICDKGLIDLEQLATVLTSKGDCLTPEELKLSFTNAPITPKGNLDCKEFCKQIVKTCDRVQEVAFQRLEDWEERMRINTKTFVVRKNKERARLTDDSACDILESPCSNPDENIQVTMDYSSWHTSHMKGSFFFNSDVIICHQYVYDVEKTTDVRVTIQPLIVINNMKAVVDTFLFIYKEESNNVKKFIGVADKRDMGSCFIWNGTLDPGRYFLCPITTGCRFKKRILKTNSEVISPPVTLVMNDEKGQLLLTDPFRCALLDIYNQTDLDDNGFLDRQEFNLFNWRTSGEEVQDEEWKVLEENFRLVEGELTVDGFLDLHQMEAEHNSGDPKELWVTLGAMGYNASLEQDEACPFRVDVFSRTDAGALRVSALKPCPDQEPFINYIIQQSVAQPLEVLGGVVLLYKFQSPVFAALIVENQTLNSVSISVDCSNSNNCTTHRDKLTWTKEMHPRSKEVAHYLMPTTDSSEWFVKFNAYIL